MVAGCLFVSCALLTLCASHLSRPWFPSSPPISHLRSLAEENRTTEKLREEEAEEAADGLRPADLKVCWLHRGEGVGACTAPGMVFPARDVVGAGVPLPLATSPLCAATEVACLLGTSPPTCEGLCGLASVVGCWCLLRPDGS
jgi:hypothetical protein